MIKKGKHIIKSHMTLSFLFSGIRVQDTLLTSVNWDLKVNLVATQKEGKAREDLEYNASVAYQKIYFWLETNLPNIVMVNVGNEDDLYIASLSSNIMMFCPAEPTDDVIIQMLHSKISVLAGDDLMVGEIQLAGSDSTLQYTFDTSPGEYFLPVSVLEYCKEGTARDTLPWWSRNDGFCCEFVLPADSEPTAPEVFNDIVDPLDEFYKWIEESTDVHIGLSKEPAKIVQIEKWKPKTV